MSNIESEAKMVEIELISDTGSQGVSMGGLNAEENNENRHTMATSPPPNGRTVAWLQVLGTFFLMDIYFVRRASCLGY